MGHEHHHDANTVEHRLTRIEKSVGRIEGSVGRTEQRVIDAQERLNRMPVSQEVTDALDVVRASLSADVAKEHDEFLAAMQTQADAAGVAMDALQAKIDALIAAGGTASPDEIAGIKGLATEVDTAIDSIVPAAVVTPPDTGTPSPAARRR